MYSATPSSQASKTSRLERPVPGVLPLLGVLLLLSLAPVRYARSAQLYVVTTTEDTVDPNDGVRSLREALAESASGDAISFAVTGTIDLASSLNNPGLGELPITHGVTITGPGPRNLTIRSSDESRVFHVNTPESVSISGLTVRDGSDPVSTTKPDSFGGGIYNEQSPLTLTECAITACEVVGINTADRQLGGFALGGGIWSSGPLTLRHCLVNGNRAQSGTGSLFSANAYGAGIYCSGPLTVVNSTLVGNIAQVPAAGGQSFGGGIYAIQSCTLVASTIGKNQAIADSGGTGAGVNDDSGVVSVQDTIVAANVASSSAGSQVSDVVGGAVSQGYNLIGARDGSHAPNSAASPWLGTDQTGTAGTPLDPGLAQLGDYGGPTNTCPLLDVSPAIDAGDDRVQSPPQSLGRDQRGFPRRMGPHVDIGAFERDVPQTGPNFVVNTLEDTNDLVPGVNQCTLGEAVAAANLSADHNTITFKPGLSGTIHLDGLGASLRITNPVTISGPGARVLAVSGKSAGQVLIVTGAGVNLSGLTIKEGFVPVFVRLSGGAQDGVNSSGGAILNTGSLTLNACTLANNSAWAGSGSNGGNGGGGFGGAISNTGDVSLTGCTLVGNQAKGGNGSPGQPSFGGYAYGGALYNEGTMSLINCTLSANVAQGGDGGDLTSGGSYGIGGAIFNNAGILSLLNCTVAANTVLGGINGSGQTRRTQGGGLSRFGGSFSVRNTVIGLNHADIHPDVDGSDYTSDGTNLVRIATGSTGWTAADKTGTAAAPLDPKLASLANNGGPTDTCALLAGSLAIDAANNGTAPARDQRGDLRSGGADIGAFEFGAIVPLAPTNDRVTPAAGASAPGAGRTFACRYLDGNGAGDFQLVYFLVNSSLSQSGGLSCCYDAVANKLYLRNNTGGAWLGGFAPGTNQVISDPNGKGSLACAKTTVMRSNNLLEVDWVLTPNSGFAGNQNLYLYSQDKEGLTDGWDPLGTWNVASKPVDTSVSPGSGSSGVGAARTLTAVYSDQNGGDDLSTVSVLVNGRLAADGGLYGTYDAVTDKLYLRNAANTAWLGGFSPGSAKTISVANGSLNCAATKVTKSAGSLTITWSFTPNGTFTGTKNVYLSCEDKTGLADGWDLLGSWTITP